LRAAYWNNIEKIICDLPINEPGQFDSSSVIYRFICFSFLKCRSNVCVFPIFWCFSCFKWFKKNNQLI
jgi:hypothetical protein